MPNKFLCDELLRDLFPQGRLFHSQVFDDSNRFHSNSTRFVDVCELMWKELRRINACYVRGVETEFTHEIVISAFLYYVTNFMFLLDEFADTSNLFKTTKLPELLESDCHIYDLVEFSNYLTAHVLFYSDQKIYITNGGSFDARLICTFITTLCNRLITELTGIPSPSIINLH